MNHYLHTFSLEIAENFFYKNVLHAYEPHEQVYESFGYYENRNCRRYLMQFSLGGIPIATVSTTEDPEIIGGHDLEVQMEGGHSELFKSLEWILS